MRTVLTTIKIKRRAGSKFSFKGAGFNTALNCCILSGDLSGGIKAGGDVTRTVIGLS